VRAPRLRVGADIRPPEVRTDNRTAWSIWRADAGAIVASAGIRKTPTGRYKVWWRLDDGTQGAKTLDTRALPRDFRNELLAQVAADSWTDPRRGRILFNEWADAGGSSGPPAYGAAPRAWRPQRATCAATCVPISAAGSSARSPPRLSCAGKTT
jgi:hypothetical protein